MEPSAESPCRAAEYLKELNKIIETQQELLEKQKKRIDELEEQVTTLYNEKSSIQEEHSKHLATCRLQLAPPGGTTLCSIQENDKYKEEVKRNARRPPTAAQLQCGPLPRVGRSTRMAPDVS
ncbi:IQ motif and SEC7 domain-containing protein 3-like [Mantella aurantiaca]